MPTIGFLGAGNMAEALIKANPLVPEKLLFVKRFT